MMALILAIIALAFSLVAGITNIYLLAKGMDGADIVKEYEQKTHNMEKDQAERELRLVDFIVDACEAGAYCGNCAHYCSKEYAEEHKCNKDCRRGMLEFFNKREKAMSNFSLLYANVPMLKREQKPLTALQTEELLKKNSHGEK